MAYFFDKIKTKTTTGEDQTLQFNPTNRPSFSIGATNYGNIVTNSGPTFTFSQQVSFNNIINSNSSLFVGGNGISFNQGDTTNSLKMNGNNIITGAGRINNLFISSPQNRSATFNTNLTVGTIDGTGSVTIASNNTVFRTLILNRSLTIETGSLNTIAYNTSTTSLGAVPGPTVNGEYNLIQKRISGVNQTPQWVSTEPVVEYSGLTRLEGTTTAGSRVITLTDDRSKQLIKYAKVGQRVRGWAGISSQGSAWSTRFGTGIYTISSVNLTNFQVTISSPSPANVTASWGFDVESLNDDEYLFTFPTNYKKVTMRALEFWESTQSDVYRTKFIEKASLSKVFYKDSPYLFRDWEGSAGGSPLLRFFYTTELLNNFLDFDIVAITQSSIRIKNKRDFAVVEFIAEY